MPPVKPIKRRDLIYYFRGLDFEGPFSGGKHQFMVKDNRRVAIPNSHNEDIGKELLKKILLEAGISKEDWIKL